MRSGAEVRRRCVAAGASIARWDTKNKANEQACLRSSIAKWRSSIMRIVEKYLHLNGLEFLLVHKPALWKEIQDVIARADASKCRTKVSKEVRTRVSSFTPRWQ